MSPIDYGARYYCIKVPATIAAVGDVHCYADEVAITASGALNLIGHTEDGKERVNLALAPGCWLAVYSASCFDGVPVAVEHWNEEIFGRGGKQEGAKRG